MAGRGSYFKQKPQWRRAISALLSEKDIASAAVVAGVSERTLYRWLNDPDFKYYLDEATKDTIVNISRTLAGMGEKAIRVLFQILDSGDTTASIKVRAADIVLGRLLQLRELAVLEERINQLEEAVYDQKK